MAHSSLASGIGILNTMGMNFSQTECVENQEELLGQTPKAGSLSPGLSFSPEIPRDVCNPSEHEKPGDRPPESANSDDSEIIISQKDIFFVEKISKKRKHNKRIEYCVKWMGYPARMNTWEPEESFLFREAIDEFEQREAEKKRKLDARRLKKRCRRTNSKTHIQLTINYNCLESNSSETSKSDFSSPTRSSEETSAHHP